MYLHPTFLVSPEREPLGVFDVYMWAREPKGADGKRPGIIESGRWIVGYERLAEQAAACPTRGSFTWPTGKRRDDQGDVHDRSRD